MMKIVINIVINCIFILMKKAKNKYSPQITYLNLEIKFFKLLLKQSNFKMRSVF